MIKSQMYRKSVSGRIERVWWGIILGSRLKMARNPKRILEIFHSATNNPVILKKSRKKGFLAYKARS